MHDTIFYKVWHQKLEQESQKIVPGVFINLEKIQTPKEFQIIWPYLQEYRAHFDRLDLSKEYIGFVSASLNSKFGEETTKLLKQRLECEDFYGADACPIVVSQGNWYRLACLYHTGIDRYIQYYKDLAKIDDKYLTTPIFYCNSFICKTDIYQKAREIFRENIIKTLEHFNYALDFHGTIYNDVRKGGCLCERLWSLTVMSLSSTFAPGITPLLVGDMVS